MERRTFLPLLFIPCLGAKESGRTFVRGRLTQPENADPVLTLPDGRIVSLDGDADTKGVLKDVRLKDSDFEVGGRFVDKDRFNIDLMHTRSLFAYKDGQRLMVTYWCEVCYIRSYTPAICWCCQEYTALDLRQPDAPDPKP